MRGPARAPHLKTPIGRAVVDGDDLVRPFAIQRLRDLVEKDGDVLFLVVDGEDDRKVGHRVEVYPRTDTPNAFSKFAVVIAATSWTEIPHNGASSSATLMTY